MWHGLRRRRRVSLIRTLVPNHTTQNPRRQVLNSCQRGPTTGINNWVKRARDRATKLETVLENSAISSRSQYFNNPSSSVLDVAPSLVRMMPASLDEVNEDRELSSSTVAGHHLVFLTLCLFFILFHASHLTPSYLPFPLSSPLATCKAKNIVDQLEVLAAFLEESLQAATRAELSILVDVLHHPDWLRNINPGMCQGQFLANLISHSHMKESEDPDGHERQLRLKVLNVLCLMMEPELFTGDDRKLRVELLSQYFDADRLTDSSFHLQPTDTLQVQPEVQNLLDSNGASDLVIDLIMVADDSKTFFEAVRLGIALLEDGNSQTQDTFYQRLRTTDSTAFFRCLSVRDKGPLFSGQC